MSEENVSIEDLRSAVENEHRFPTTFQGFSKKAVNAYLKDLEEEYKQSLVEYDEKRLDIMKENEKLNEKVEILNARINELNARLDEKRENDEKIRQAVMSEMSVKANQLKSEKRELELKLTEAEKELADLKSDIKEAVVGLDGMSAKLEKMLKEKLSECTDIIRVWETQHEAVVREVENQIVSKSDKYAF